MLHLNKDRSDLETLLLGGPFSVFQYELSIKLDAITLVIDDAESFLRDRKAELEKKYDDELSKLDRSKYELISDYAQKYRDDFNLYSFTTFQALYNSIFLNAFALFESSMKVLFKYLNESQGNKAQIKERPTINDYVLKFKKDLDIDFESNSEWQLIQSYREIRNCIAHRNGEIEDSDQNNLKNHPTYIALSKLKGGYTLDKDNLYFRLNSKSFVTDFIDTVKRFYQEIEKSPSKAITDWPYAAKFKKGGIDPENK